jgi:DNA-directed RNA polymerase subunit RPC12/RpoP
MRELAHHLEDLSCSVCGTRDALWLDSRLRVVECRECGSKASIIVEAGGGDW